MAFRIKAANFNPIPVVEASGDPSAVANTGFIYAKEVSSRTELFYIDDNGGVVQITSNGVLNSGEVTSLNVTAATAGTDVISTDVTGDTNKRFVMNADGSMEWGPGNAAADLILSRGAAAVLAQRNGTTAQNFHVYNTYTDASNYERLRLGWNSNFMDLHAEAAGTGAVRQLRINAAVIYFQGGGSTRWNVNSSGHFMGGIDNTYDIGASGATRPRTGYFGTSVDVVAGSVLLDTNGITMGDAKNIIANATTGTKIGTATTQKIGFWNATPVVQPTAVADAGGGAVIDAEARTALNALLARVRTVGFIAT